MEPLQPNGRIISYSVYLDNTRIPEINSTEPASHVVNDLLPYTVYEFKVGGPSQPSLWLANFFILKYATHAWMIVR